MKYTNKLSHLGISLVLEKGQREWDFLTLSILSQLEATASGSTNWKMYFWDNDTTKKYYLWYYKIWNTTNLFISESFINSNILCIWQTFSELYSYLCFPCTNSVLNIGSHVCLVDRKWQNVWWKSWKYEHVHVYTKSLILCLKNV